MDIKKFLLFIFTIVFTTDSFGTGISPSITNPVCDSATLNQYSGTANVEINWEPNVIDLRWYDGETQLNVPTEAQSCTYDGAMYIPTQPTKTGYTFMGWEVIVAIPEEYTQLTYIESTGAQWINTGISPDLNTRIDYKLQIGVYCDCVLIGARLGDSGVSHRYYPFAFGGNNALRSVFGDQDIVFSSTESIFTGSFRPADNITIINGTAYPLNATFEKTENYNLCLFASSTGYNTTFAASPGKIYYVNIYQNSIPVRRMIPARRNSDNVIGMWDTVSKTFFTNAGAGSFVAGPVVE